MVYTNYVRRTKSDVGAEDKVPISGGWLQRALRMTSTLRALMW